MFNALLCDIMAVQTFEGHATHTKPADSQEGLKGNFTRPIHITFLGAGSGFCPNLCRDVLLIPGADRGEFRLCDIDESRLRISISSSKSATGYSQILDSRCDPMVVSPRVRGAGPWQFFDRSSRRSGDERRPYHKI